MLFKSFAGDLVQLGGEIQRCRIGLMGAEGDSYTEEIEKLPHSFYTSCGAVKREGRFCSIPMLL